MAHVVTKPTPIIARAADQLGAHALGYPGTTEAHPWGHRAFKVSKKTFLFLYADAAGLSVSVKLPTSGQLALELPFAEPTGYGLGKSGWVSAKFAPSARVPVGLLREWIDESFRAIAPRRVVAGLAAPVTTDLPRKTSKRKRAVNAAKHPTTGARARTTKPRKRALSTKPR